MEWVLGIVFVLAMVLATANVSPDPTPGQKGNQWLAFLVLVIVAVIGVSIVGGQ
jgi:nitrate reductase NapE component